MLVHIRWLVRRDMPEVLEIENQCFEFPWSEDDFVRFLRQRNCIGMVAEHQGQVIGTMIYELHRQHLHVLSFAVATHWHRQGVGRAMVDKLRGKLSNQRRNHILLEVRESNLAAQMFFRAVGFKATGILREFYDEMKTTEDAIRMRHEHLDRVVVRCRAWDYSLTEQGSSRFVGQIDGLAKRYGAPTLHELVNVMGEAVHRYYGDGVEMVFEHNPESKVVVKIVT